MNNLHEMHLIGVKMEKNNRHGYTIVIVMLFLMLFGCSKNAIKLESVYRTSDSLNCHTVFADTRKSIVERSEILIQLGTIDTLEDSSPDVAIIHHQGKTVILDLLESKHEGEITRQYYGGNGYKLNLTYSLKKLDNGSRYYDTYYDGTCEVSHGSLISEMHVEGVRNRL